MQTSHHRLAILGSGPAGLTAAIYSARAMLQPVVFEGMQAGGQLTTTTEVENYPAFPEGISGPELVLKMREQAARFDTRFITQDVDSVDLTRRPFTLRSYEHEVSADALIIATGASARYLGIPSEERLRNHGVSACATCDGFFYRDQQVAVIGGGDTAAEEALFLTRFASKVSLIHRRDALRASKIMAARVLAHGKIEPVWNSVVEEYLGDPKGDGLTGLRLRNVETGEVRDLPVTGAFVAIGHKPNTDLFRGALEMDETGYLKTKPGRTATNIPGVWAAGDCADHYYRQAITAAGTGCMAAIEAERWLTEQAG
ncbi:MAG: thioredoxin-disulfide reductase [Polyangia bacterium]|jgi:thioredoxin reductase (NADPH)|nr:thioredoxin-disulfide reductase [Polyangia bacterium]